MWVDGAGLGALGAGRWGGTGGRGRGARPA